MADEPTPQGTPQGEPTPTPTPTPVPSPPPSAPTVTDPAARIAELTAQLADWKSQSRKHEDREKANAKALADHQATLKMLAEKAGVPFNDGAPDAAALATQVTQAQADAAARARELAVFRAAAAANANADLLLDSRTFMARTEALDPSDPAFTDQVKAMVAEQVTANPALAATPPAAAPPAPQLPTNSGGNFNGAPGGDRQWTKDDVDRASPEELSKAINAGYLQSYGIGKPKASHRR